MTKPVKGFETRLKGLMEAGLVARVHVATPDELTAGRCCRECLRSSLGEREPDTGLFCQLHGKYTRDNFCCDAFEPPFYFYTTPHL